MSSGIRGRIMSRIFIQLAVVVGLLALGATASNAQATRTCISGVGDDANPCSRTAPCKTFAGATSKTAAGGEISVLDPGGYGAVTITKSISIVSEGSEGSIRASGTNGIIINAASTDIVNLHGLLLEGAGTGIKRDSDFVGSQCPYPKDIDPRLPNDGIGNKRRTKHGNARVCFR
jgi:hypothetical protein